MRHEDPPMDPYSRVTNPERFAPLHILAGDLFAELESRYAITRDADARHFPKLRPDQFASAPVCLTPVSVLCAPLRIAFTTFPGLMLSAGWNVLSAFPGCGCDACAETAEGEIERLTTFVRCVVAGEFEETIRNPFFGHATYSWSISGAMGMRASTSTVMAKAEARALIKRVGTHRRHWTAWQLRG